MKHRRLNSTPTPGACIAVILGLMLSATALAQQLPAPSRTAYESALLDSTYLYLQLKPLYRQLQKVHEVEHKENLQLRTENAMLVQQKAIDKQTMDETVARCERKLKWAKVWGNVKTVGAVVGTVFVATKVK